MTNKIISKPIKCFHFLSYTKSSSLQKKREREPVYKHGNKKIRKY